jgi:hypothetical protein
MGRVSRRHPLFQKYAPPYRHPGSTYQAQSNQAHNFGKTNISRNDEARQNDSADNLGDSRASTPAFVRAIPHEASRRKDKGKKRAPPNNSWYDSIPNILPQDRAPTLQDKHPTRYTPTPQDPVFDRPPSPVEHAHTDDGAMEPPTWSIISGPTTPLFYFHDPSSSAPSQPEVATHSDHGHGSNEQRSSNMFGIEDKHGGEKAPASGNEFGGEGSSVGDDEFGGAEAYVGDNELDDHGALDGENSRGHFVSSLFGMRMHILTFVPSSLKSFFRNSMKLANDSPVM